MSFLRIIFIVILISLVAIGDGVIFAVKKIFNLLKIKPLVGFFHSTRRAEIIVYKRKHKPSEKTIVKKIKRPTKIAYFPFSFWLKLRYFVIGGIFSSIFVFLPLLFFVFIQDLPTPKTLVLGQIAQTTKIYDRNGVLLYQIYADQNRTIVPLNEVPKHLQSATIAIEDKDFYKHPGFDISAIIRSAMKNFQSQELQGGSTITQQLIKSALLTPETSLTRKVKEVFLAFWTERTYPKDKILEMYFNQVAYGGTTWGIEAAAQTYFGKNAKDLDLAESTFLAGIPKAPSIYSPFGSTPTLWKKRQSEVLEKMVSLGYITQEDAAQAKEQELVFKTPQIPLRAPHFVMYVRDLLAKKYGQAFVERGGLTVITSLDLAFQDKVQKIVSDEVASNATLNLTNGAVLVTNPKNGDILAMVGSKDFFDPSSGNVNVTTSLRQPGSSIKVVTYAAALSRGFTAATILDDSPVNYVTPGGTTYSPVNYDGKFHGRPSLRVALANSFNIPAVRTLNQIGVPTFIALGKQMGITTWNDTKRYGLSITLGGAEVTMVDMATVYGVLANGGIKVDVDPILSITDGKGNIYEDKKITDGKKVLDQGVAFILSSILADNQARALEFGINSPLNISGYTVPVKTGTSDNKRDNWTIGYTKDRLVAVWVGNNDGSAMSQTLASGITGAAPIWNKIMSGLLKGKPDKKLALPANIIAKPCLGRIEYFIKGTENSVNCAYTPTPTPSPSG